MIEDFQKKLKLKMKVENNIWWFEFTAFVIYGAILLIVVISGIELCSLLFEPRLAPTEQFEKQIMHEERNQIGEGIGKTAFDHLKDKFE